LAGIGVVVLLIASLWFDEGEVVTLITMDAGGNHYETSLWVVDLEGLAFVRAQSSSPPWLDRIREISEVKLDRSGRHTDHHAIPIDDEKVREAVNQLMAEKYGCFEKVSQWFRDYSRSIPIQLQPTRSETSHADRSIGDSR
jgi:hypothetical protein